ADYSFSVPVAGAHTRRRLFPHHTPGAKTPEKVFVSARPRRVPHPRGLLPVRATSRTGACGALSRSATIVVALREALLALGDGLRERAVEPHLGHHAACFPHLRGAPDP